MADIITLIQQPLEEALSQEVQEMMKAGMFYGSTKTKTHPKMKRFVLANRNGVEIIDLEKTVELFARAVEEVSRRAREGGHILFVGTQPYAQDAIKKLAETFQFPYVTTRWLGGTITNYDVISKRIEWYKKLQRDKAAGVFEKYTKKEQLDITKQIEKLKTTLGGLETMTERPRLLIVIDPAVHKTAMREAKRKNIPVVALVTTDYNPEDVEYPVIANTKARASVQWFLDRIQASIEKARKDAASKKSAEEAASIEKEGN